MYQKYFKSLFDIFLSLILIILLFPIMILIFFLVWLIIGSPIFIQKRPGLKGKIFTIYKFKTLYDAPKFISEKKRQNKFGKFLRKSGLDELPQLFNILERNMSFVGPRPLLVDYLKKYSSYEKKRHLVKPGLTGLAQINPEFSGKKSWKKSIRYDIFYVSKISFLLDMKILFRTVILILFKKKQFEDFKKIYE